MFRRIEVPLDGSRLAEAVLPVVAALAARLGAAVELLHVLERKAPATVHGQRHLRREDEAAAYLFSEVARPLEAAGVPVHGHVHDVPEANVAASIADHATELRADLIALATHGSGGMRDIVFGSVAQQVLRRTALPVLLVRPGAAGEGEWRRFLVALDGTAQSEPAIPIAAGLAEALGAELTLLCVVPSWATLPARGGPTALLMPGATAAALDLQAEKAMEYLEGVARSPEGAGSRARGVVRRGDPAREIVQAAREEKVDLVVMATHARAGLAASWTGSVASRILKSLPVPALLVRTPA